MSTAVSSLPGILMAKALSGIPYLAKTSTATPLHNFTPVAEVRFLYCYLKDELLYRLNGV